MDKLLTIIEKNARLTLEEIAAMVGETPEETARRLDDYKRQGVLRGTRTLINWEKVGGNGVQALIEVRVSPKKAMVLMKLPRLFPSWKKWTVCC